MRIEQGTVVQIEGGRVLVEANGETFCAACEARNSCLMDSASHKRHIWIDNTIGARNGDGVSFKIEEKGVVLSSMLLYLLPVVLLFSGALFFGLAAPVWQWKYDSELLAVIGGFAGLLVYVIILKVLYPFIKKRNIFAPVLVSNEDLGKD